MDNYARDDGLSYFAMSRHAIHGGLAENTKLGWLLCLLKDLAPGGSSIK